MIKTILFDFYGVFLSDTYTVWLEAHGLTRTGEYQSIVEQLDSGKMTSDEFYRKLSGLSHDSESSIQDAFHTPPRVNESVVELLRVLSKTYTVALASNGTSHTRELLKNMHIEDVFNALFISSEMGVTKPHPEFFSAVIETLGVPAHEIVLIDDSPTNIASAKALGFETIQYSTIGQLIDSLAQLDIHLND